MTSSLCKAGVSAGAIGHFRFSMAVVVAMPEVSRSDRSELGSDLETISLETVENVSKAIGSTT